MINQRNNFINLSRIRQEFKHVISEDEMKNIESLVRMYQRYQAGANEIGTKLSNLDDDFRLTYDYAPIHSIEARMKSPESLMGKINRKKLPINVESIQNNIFDVAGIRVVTSYIDDAYSVADLLKQQSDITVIKEKDYIKNPKNNGYRSLHVIFSVPVFQTDGVYDIPVEVQFRTIGMDFWASLEHELVYKNNLDPKVKKQYQADLEVYAEELSNMDTKMREIFKDLYPQN
ncbi:GTP pyrophosphokinase [Xylocopilactobacillus apis]|uniref:GTP pyrophosphokinase n=1 Tax=Xylocopilactobacillus apis TaxID=2932183 RepID=A0AAU9DKJ8_9LACO|nr:GTP pyrophosphokinase family protein [Xylocopilactobacillus apis]BDR56014.1 GTP pyrophosphokinase [Xylocopilactobacillus apis]